MECRYCSNKLPNEARFCNKCGKPVEVEKPTVDVEKIRKNLKNTGNSVNAVGWLTIIINVGFYLWGLLDSSLAKSGDFPVPDLTSTVLRHCSKNGG